MIIHRRFALLALLAATPSFAQAGHRPDLSAPFHQGDVHAEDVPPIPDDEVTDDEISAIAAAPAPVQTSGALGRTVASVPGVAPGEIVIRTKSHMLYYGLPEGGVRAYPVAVGKRGAQWHGEAVVGRKAVNPTWHPTARQRRLKRLPSMVKAGPRNPLGVRALYLYQDGRDTLYRIHGTNAPGSIGRSVSSGCIRMRNPDVVDLFARVPRGTRVVVE